MVDSADQLTLRGFAENSSENGSTVYTDEHSGYSSLLDIFNEFSHGTVKHSVGEYVKREAPAMLYQ